MNQNFENQNTYNDPLQIMEEENPMTFDPDQSTDLGQQPYEQQNQYRQNPAHPAQTQMPMKYCKFCGSRIPQAAVICTHCGCQVENFAPPVQSQYAHPQYNQGQYVPPYTQPQNIVINQPDPSLYGIRTKNKWISFGLCLCFGYLGAHKFYEEKIGMGILYLVTGGLFGVGWLIDSIALLVKPNPYYLR